MSALGQKQTCAAQKAVSALPPKADMCSALTHVRFRAISGHGHGPLKNRRGKPIVSPACISSTFTLFVMA